jgi:hypothetical protein
MTAKPPSLNERIVALIGDGKPHRAAELVAALPGHRRVHQALAALAAARVIDRVRRGVYKLPARPRIGRKRKFRMSRGLRRIYRLLDEPRTAVELRQKLGITRQAIHKALNTLIGAGKLRRNRLPLTRVQYVYERADHDKRPASEIR